MPGQPTPVEGLQDDNFRITIDLDLGPFESTSIAILNFHAFDPTTRTLPNNDSDLILATARADEIVMHPADVYRGLSAQDRALIANFVPLPSSVSMGLVLLVGLGVVAVVCRKRRETRGA